MSPLAPVGNRAFRALSGALGLKPNEVLNRVQTGDVVPSLDFRSSLVADTGDLWAFRAALSTNNNETTSLTSFHEDGTPSTWTGITRGVQPVTARVPADHDFLVFSAGVRVSTSTNFVYASISTQGSTPAVNSAAGEILYFGDTVDGALNRNVFHATGQTVIRPFPWYFPSEQAVDVDMAAESGATAITHNFLFRGISLPKGILSPFGS